jgi:hypothetical protein
VVSSSNQFLKCCHLLWKFFDQHAGYKGVPWSFVSVVAALEPTTQTSQLCTPTSVSIGPFNLVSRGGYVLHNNGRKRIYYGVQWYLMEKLMTTWK